MAHLFPKVVFTNSINSPLEKAIHQVILDNNLRGFVSKEQATTLKKEFSLTDKELYFAMLPFAACYAYPTVSKFYVGAIVEDLDGNFFFGANQEWEGMFMQFTVHAEQCAINHAFVSGAKGIKSIIVNYSPCGQCRQFINEVNTAKNLKIYLPQIPDGAPLSYYLPDSFGPDDLDVSVRLFDDNQYSSYFTSASRDQVVAQVQQEAVHSYSPYSNSHCFVVASTDDNRHFVGRYIENAAYSPSFSPILSSLTLARLYGVDGTKEIKSLYIEEDTKTQLPLKAIGNFFAENFGLELTYKEK